MGRRKEAEKEKGERNIGGTLENRADCNAKTERQHWKNQRYAFAPFILQKQEHFCVNMTEPPPAAFNPGLSCTVVKGYVRRQAEEAEVSPFSRATYGGERGIVVTACSHFEAPAACLSQEIQRPGISCGGIGAMK